MSDNKDNKTIKPLGKAEKWTEADLNRLSAIDEADIEAAGELWHQNAPQRFKSLLNARLTNDNGNIQE